MAGTTGIGTTFSLPNYHGELLAITPAETPFLTAIGGLSGGKQTTSTAFEWQVSDRRNPAQPSVLEGAAAPTAQERVRANVSNVVQIFHEAVAVSYTKLAATGQYATPGSAPYRSLDGTPNPVTSELDWQTQEAMATIASDVNFTLLNGHINVPTTNSDARRTAGLISVCTTNAASKATATLTSASTATDTITVTHALNNGDQVVFTNVGAATNVVEGRVYYVVSKSTTVSFKVAETAGGAAITLGTATVDLVALRTAALTDTEINTFIQGVYDNGGMRGGNPTLLVNSSQKIAISKAYGDAYAKANPVTGNRVGGVVVDTVLTDFGALSVMLDPHVPKDAIVAASMDQIAPVFLNIPGKGVFFEEPLAKVGASEQVQLYGEIGLEHGNERAHGVLRGLAA